MLIPDLLELGLLLMNDPSSGPSGGSGGPGGSRGIPMYRENPWNLDLARRQFPRSLPPILNLTPAENDIIGQKYSSNIGYFYYNHTESTNSLTLRLRLDYMTVDVCVRMYEST